MTYLATILVYLVILFVFGLRVSRRLKRKEDFLVAGRTLTAPILVGTLLASWIGSGDIFSVSDLSYNHGYSSLIGSAGGWLGIIILAGLLAGVVVALAQAGRMALRRRQYGLAVRMAEAAAAQRAEADRAKQELFRRKRRELEQVLATLEVADVEAAERLLETVDAQTETLAQIEGELRGLGVDGPNLRRIEEARDAARCQDVSGTLETAIRLEKDSVLFYGELLADVDQNDTLAIQDIINEEKRHVRALIEAKRKLKSSTTPRRDSS